MFVILYLQLLKLVLRIVALRTQLCTIVSETNEKLKTENNAVLYVILNSVSDVYKFVRFHYKLQLLYLF